MGFWESVKKNYPSRPKSYKDVEPSKESPVKSYKDVKPSTTSPVKSYKDVAPTSSPVKSGGGGSGGSSSRKKRTPPEVTPERQKQIEEEKKQDAYIQEQGRLAAEKVKTKQPLTETEAQYYKAYESRQRDLAYRGEKFNLWTAPLWAWRKVDDKLLGGRGLRNKEMEYERYIEAKKPRDEDIAKEMQPTYQQMVNTGTYKIDEQGYLVGSGKEAWEKEFTMRKESKQKQFSAELKKEFPEFKSSKYQDIAMGVWGFTFFSPAMTTGGTQQQVVKKKGKIGESRFSGLSEELDKTLKGDYFKQTGKKVTYVGKTTTKEKADILKGLLSKTSDPKLKAEILKASYKSLGEKEFGRVISYFPKSSQVSYTATKTATKSASVGVNIEAFNIASMDYIGTTGALANFTRFSPPQQKTKDVQFTSPFNTTDIGQATDTDLKPKSKFKTRTITLPATSTSTSTAIIPATATFTGTITRLTPSQNYKFGQDFPSESGRGRFSGRYLFPIPKINLGGDFGKLKSGQVKAFPSFKYTPSFTALVKGQKGKQPKIKTFKGFEARPITSNWANTLGLKPKKRKKRRGLF